MTQLLLQQHRSSFYDLPRSAYHACDDFTPIAADSQVNLTHMRRAAPRCPLSLQEGRLTAQHATPRDPPVNRVFSETEVGLPGIEGRSHRRNIPESLTMASGSMGAGAPQN